MGISRQQLEFQAERIEAVLASHKIPARVAGGTVTPRYIRFDLLPPPGVPLRRIQNLAEEVALFLGATSCRIVRQAGQLKVEVPRPDPRPVQLLPLCRNLPPVPPNTAILGLDDEGIPVLLRLSSADIAHVLIAGNTGSGKTALARTMALSLAMYNRPSTLQLVLIDPKQRGLAPLASLPHLLFPLIADTDTAADALSRLVREMERRDLEGHRLPRIVVFIDELADLVMMGGTPILHALTRLTQRGREAGIHIIACTQKPTAASIGSLIKSNFPCRLVGSVASAEDARIAAGLPKTGAEKLPGHGSFILVVRGETLTLQVAYIDPTTAQKVASHLSHTRRSSSPTSVRPLKEKAQTAIRRLASYALTR